MRAKRNISNLRLLRRKIIFLNLVPNSLYFSLSSAEFYIPTAKIFSIRVELENILGHYVMTYKRDVFLHSEPIETHLCAHLQGANLSRKQKILLYEYENRYRKENISFVVYQKPLKIIHISESNIFNLYKRLNDVSRKEKLSS